MSPKRLSNLAIILAGISILGIIAMAFLRPGWGLLSWWPLAGLGLSLLLILFALAKGASMTAQRRVDIVDVTNDCYAGVPQSDTSDTA